MTTVGIDADILEAMLPMMLMFDVEGRIVRIGRTLERMSPGAVGLELADVLRFVYPALPAEPERLLPTSGKRLRVRLLSEANVGLEEEHSQLRGTVVPLSDGSGLINFSLGADPALALRRHRLTATDFAATDPMVDYLYLIEVHRLLYLEFERQSARIEKARREAEHAAITDKLTGLHNRRAMDDHLSRLTQQTAQPFGLMNLDLDYFKTVNDTLGHAAGDHVLEEVARILKEEVRTDDMVARVGGDEFMMVFDDCTDVELLRQIAARIIRKLEQPMEWQGQQCRISGSIGITMSSYYSELLPDKMVSDVDSALYEAKRAGRAQSALVQPAARAS